jgi:CheY-like chemotaxis protein
MPRQSALSDRVVNLDDDVRQRNALIAVLPDNKGDTQVATDGFEALERLAAFQSGVIVADLVTPGMDGFELLRRLKERGDLTPAIALTGFDSMDSARAFKILLDRVIRRKKVPQKVEALTPWEFCRRTWGYGRKLPGDATDIFSDQKGCVHLRCRPDSRREWYRKGVGCSGNP